jgi:hypothetical protein
VTIDDTHRDRLSSNYKPVILKTEFACLDEGIWLNGGVITDYGRMANGWPDNHSTHVCTTNLFNAIELAVQDKSRKE